MADKWDWISHVLEREEKEFQQAMPAEVGTTSLCTINSSKMEFLKVFTGTSIITQHTARKEPKFKTRYVPWHYWSFIEKALCEARPQMQSVFKFSDVLFALKSYGPPVKASSGQEWYYIGSS